MAINRRNDIDILKGIGMLLVVIHHAPMVYRGQYPVIDAIGMWYNNIITPFFMAVFFVATGFCSNFTPPITYFLSKNTKGLMLPSILLYILVRFVGNVDAFLFAADNSYLTLKHWVAPGLSTWFREGGVFWFISALFISKVIYQILYKTISDSKIRMAMSILLSIIGMCLSAFDVPEFFFYRQALIMIVFLEIGVQIREREDVVMKYAKYLGIVYVVIILLLQSCGYGIPSVTRTIAFNTFFDYLLFFPLAFMGTIFVWFIAKRIKTNRQLEYIGRNTLIIYAFNYAVLSIAAHATMFFLMPQSSMMAIVMLVISTVISIVVLVIISQLLNLKYLRFILGKF